MISHPRVKIIKNLMKHSENCIIRDGDKMIRFANENDIPDIMTFIDDYWRKGHILSRDRKLFEFQYCWEKEVSFVISGTEGKITGVLGFIPYDQENRDVTLAIWKTVKTKNTMLGISILNYLRENGNVRTLSAPGINPKTIAIYKFLGLGTGIMRHWYRLRDISGFKIAKVADREIPNYLQSSGLSISCISDFDQAVNEFGIETCLVRKHQLRKSTAFVERRYFRHPAFEYIKYGLKLGEAKLFVVFRVQPCNNSFVLRLIDAIGDQILLQYFSEKIDELLEQYKCEYVDCYEAGVEDSVFLRGGWKRVLDSGNIMPDYFAPFEQRNIDIYYMSEIDNVILFKGDGDMDRPN